MPPALFPCSIHPAVFPGKLTVRKYALWYSCTTYAFLVSVTNLAVAAYVAVRLGWRRKIFGRGRVVLRVLGAGVAAAGGAMLCFIPLRMTMLQAERAGVGSAG